MKTIPTPIATYIEAALNQSEEQRRVGALADAWSLLEKAHIASQPWVRPHLRVHWRMLGFAYHQRDAREAAGQVLRLLLVIPGTILGRLPAGNTGGANVNPFLPMPIPEEIQQLLSEE
jgi:hypothetical protein